MSFLQLDRVTKTFGAVTAVDHVSLEIEEGEFFALLGPSGCGKTTTLRMIAGLVQPTSGRILLDGKDITPQPPRARQLGMVFQSYALFPHLSIFENVAFGLRVRRMTEPQIRHAVQEALALVQLEGMGERFPRQLSGGQQQRVALARAIVVQPRVLLFDEPLSNLDAKLREQLRDEIRAVQKRVGITAVHVTHDQAEALAVADRLAVMHRGRVEQVGTPVEVYESPANRLVADFIGRINPVQGTVERDGEGLVLVTAQRWRIPLRPNAAADPGGALTVVVRPERVRLLPAGEGIGLGRTTGTVISSSYFGGQIQLRIALGEESLVAIIPNLGGESPRSGTKVGIEVRADDCTILAA